MDLDQIIGGVPGTYGNTIGAGSVGPPSPRSLLVTTLGSYDPHTVSGLPATGPMQIEIFSSGGGGGGNNIGVSSGGGGGGGGSGVCVQLTDEQWTTLQTMSLRAGGVGGASGSDGGNGQQGGLHMGNGDILFVHPGSGGGATGTGGAGGTFDIPAGIKVVYAFNGKPGASTPNTNGGAGGRGSGSFPGPPGTGSTGSAPGGNGGPASGGGGGSSAGGGQAGGNGGDCFAVFTW